MLDLYLLLDRAKTNYDEQHLLTEIVSLSAINKKKDIGRGGHLARKVGRAFVYIALTGGIGGLYASLSEAGILPSTESHAFSRFSGLVTIHAKRLGIMPQIVAVRAEATKIIESWKAKKIKPDPKALAKLYADLLSSQLAIVVAGFYNKAKSEGATPEKLKRLKADFTTLKTSAVKGSGFRNRAKSFIGGGIFAAVMPAYTLISFYVKLADKNQPLKLIALGNTKLAKHIS